MLVAVVGIGFRLKSSCACVYITGDSPRSPVCGLKPPLIGMLVIQPTTGFFGVES